jgi:hypothetical protein
MNLRKRSLFVVPAALGIALVAGAGPASAAPSNGPNYHANCAALTAFYGDSTYPGLGGQYNAYIAQNYGPPGQFCFI